MSVNLNTEYFTCQSCAIVQCNGDTSHLSENDEAVIVGEWDKAVYRNDAGVAFSGEVDAHFNRCDICGENVLITARFDGLTYA